VTKLTLLKTPAQPEREVTDYTGIYTRIFSEKIAQVSVLGHLSKKSECFASKNKDVLKAITKQAVYSGVKAVCYVYDEEFSREVNKTVPTRESVECWMDVYSLVDGCISTLTPSELMSVFPIHKDFNGKKTETKDYFSTMEKINEIGLDSVLGRDRAVKLLFNYHNNHVFDYVIAKLGIISLYNQYNGGRSLAEEFAEKLNLTPYRLMTGVDGKEFMYDPVKQTSYAVAKPRPRYLRLLKSVL